MEYQTQNRTYEDSNITHTRNSSYDKIASIYSFGNHFGDYSRKDDKEKIQFNCSGRFVI